MSLRPSGQLSWLLNRLGAESWDIVGCVSPEDRWSTAWTCVGDKVAKQHYLQVVDEHAEAGNLTAREYQARLDHQLASAERVPRFRPADVARVGLLDRNPQVVKTATSIADSLGASVILDATCMPKRYLFPLLKLILERAPDNLVVAYTSPNAHGPTLGHSPDDWAPLPLFGTEIGLNPLIIASVGYEPSGLAQILGEMSKAETDLRFILPVGTSASSSRRSWEFLHHVWPDLPPHWQTPPLRVEVHDLSGTFDVIRKVIDCTSRSVVFAPFGPKPVSVAMCLLASSLECATALYSQPSYYSENYSTGVHEIAPGVPACIGHCIRLCGDDAYPLG